MRIRKPLISQEGQSKGKYSLAWFDNPLQTVCTFDKLTSLIFSLNCFRFINVSGFINIFNGF